MADKKIITKPTIDLVSNHFKQLRVPLAHIYYQAWSKEGLCSSLEQAQTKIDSFDPSQAYVLLSDKKQPLALVNTLLVDDPDISTFINHYPTYAAIEAASSKKQQINNPTYRICFSLTALPGYRIKARNLDKDVSLSRYLLENLPKAPQKLAYSRIPAIGLHQHLGAEVVATLENSRPADIVGEGKNILLLYP